jgi:hypothetical protein
MQKVRRTAGLFGSVAIPDRPPRCSGRNDTGAVGWRVSPQTLPATAPSDRGVGARFPVAMLRPAGLGITATRRHALEVYDSLVRSGHAVAVEDPSLPEGRSYQLSEQVAEAWRRVIEQRAEQAEQN